MNKKQLAANVAAKTGLTNVMVSKNIDAIFNAIKENLENEGSITLKGFGSFSIGNRMARNGIDPSTQKPMSIPARKVVKFTVSKNINVNK